MQNIKNLTGGPAILHKLRERTRMETRMGNDGNDDCKTRTPLIIVGFGSETGTSEEIAKIIHAGSIERGFSSKVMCLDQVDLQQIVSSSSSSFYPPVLIIVTSSTGDGDPPNNAQKFPKRLENIRGLEGLRFTILGLGDSNYTRYQNFPRTIKKQLLAKGVTSFYQCREVDEVDGIDGAVDEWMEGLWNVLNV